MAYRSKKEKPISPLDEIISKIKSDNPSIKSKKSDKDEEIVDIITFCNGEQYLNLVKNGLTLWMSQRVILKCFYKNTIGNDDLKLTTEEWEWLYDNEENEELEGFVYERNIKDVIKKMMDMDKYHTDKSAGNDFNEGKDTSDQKAEYFSMLHLVLGRRGSKTLMASIITVYEAYKLLVVNGGDMHEYYNLPFDDEVAIINVALSQAQAGRLFGQIQARLRNSPFFKNKIAKSTNSEIRLYTDSDLRKKEAGVDVDVNGSVILLCGHSNPDSLAGYSAILILFDEIAFYDESGKVTGTYFFNRLKPSLSKFFQTSRSYRVFGSRRHDASLFR